MQSTSSTALLVLDLQNEMIDPSGKIGRGGLARVAHERGVLANMKTAIDAARSRGDRIVFVRLGFRPDYADALSVAPRIARLKQEGAAVSGTWGCEFPASIAPRDDELIVTKQCVNPFFNTGLMNWIQHRKISRLAMGGVVTNLVVESTARAADDAGFEVVVLEDCCAAPNPSWHQFAIQNTLPLFGRIASAAEFASEF